MYLKKDKVQTNAEHTVMSYQKNKNTKEYIGRL